MYPSRLTLATILMLLAAGTARPGIYNTAEPPIAMEANLTTFLRIQLAELRSLGPPDPLTGSKPGKAREDYLQKVQQLREKQARGRLSAEEQANLGAYLIRLRRTRDGIQDLEEAVQVLEAARREHPRNFNVLANLGTAYQITGRLDAAESCLQDAQALVPTEHRTVERHHLVLVRQRLREQVTMGLAPLDQLFVGPNQAPLRFVGEDGQWRAGELAAVEQQKLLAGGLEEATAIVQQLLGWLPDDARLHWLLGELANAQGDVRAAHLALDKAVYDFRLSTPDLKRRRTLLEEVVTRLKDAAMWKEYFERVGGWDRQRGWILESLAAGLQGAGPSPDVGQQVVWELYLVRKPADPFGRDEAAGPSGPTGSTALAILSNLDWRGWLIIGVGGLLIAYLAFLQVRHFLRWRARRT